MSAPPARHGPTTPLRGRSDSQTNKPGIRLVRYSPPRLDPDDRAPSQASSRDNAASRSSGNYSDKLQSARSSWRDEVTESRAEAQGSALSSPTAPSVSLVKSRDERVSGVKPLASPSGVGPAAPTMAPLKSSSEASPNISGPDPLDTRPSRAVEPSSAAPAAPQRPRSHSRRRMRLALHPNGTFSLVPEEQEPQSDARDSVAGSLTSPHPSYASRSPSAQDRPSTDSWSDRRASTPLTGASTVIPDQSFSEQPCSTPSSRASSATHLAEDPTASSPWNYRLVGGVRKVPSTPENKGKQPLYTASTSSSETQLAPLPEGTSPIDEEEEEVGDATPTRSVLPKASFASVASKQTIETVSEATNYKVYGPASSAQESSDSLVFASASASNWEVLGQSPAPAFPSSPPTLPAGDSENYVLHGAPSASPSSSLATVCRKPRPVYSQESLVVAPLRPAKRKSYESFGYYKQRSRETLRSRTGSVQSLKSLSSVIVGQDPSQALAPVVLNLGASTSQRFPWSVPPRSGSDSSKTPGTVAIRPPASMLPSHPHQWSSQLSTVMSESEGGSDPARSVSPLSEATGGHHRRGSSTGWVSSMHSRQMASISSSIAEQADEADGSPSDLVQRPQPSHAGPSQIRMVRDQDEHGDGLADLDHRPSKTGLSALFANGSNWNLHSNASSRANSLTSSIPAWARVYYGSGERRFLGRRPSFLTISDDSDSRPPSSGFLGSESPNTDNFPQAIFSPRRRPREVQPATGQRSSPDQASMDISPAPQGQGHGDYRVFRSLKQKTSSIWSPHLYLDRRATRYSLWDPPSVSWSADSGIMGKRNAQVVLFMLGFIFPLAWIIAAFLPLPANPAPPMAEADESQNRFSPVRPAYSNRNYIADETRYASARWWRNLNRVMSIVGLLIIGAVIALAVVGVRQGWGES